MKPITRRIFRWILAGVGILSLILGLTQGQFFDVLQKAVKVCLECIGIG